MELLIRYSILCKLIIKWKWYQTISQLTQLLDSLDRTRPSSSQNKLMEES